MNYKTIFTKVLPHIIAILVMFIVSSVYFYPAWEGKTLQGEDVIGSYGQGREKRDFKFYEEKETVLWNGSIFGGMPDYIGAPYKGADNLKQVYRIPQKLGVPREVASIFWYMLGFYILMIIVGVSPKLSAGGAIAYALTSYYVIIILAGHFMKVFTLSLIPPTLGGIILCFRRKYLWGFVIASFFMAMMITMAHIQMIYYFFLALLIFGAVELIYQIKEKTLPQFLKTMGVLVAAAVLAIAPNYSRLINYYLYNDQSMRGPSELTLGKEDTKETNGLDKDYINSWSSGVDESMMVIVPNVKGGMTSQIGRDKDLLEKAPRNYRNVFANFNQYWGDQPFSGGPNYLGVVFVFLFLLGAFTIKDRLKLQIMVPAVLFFFLAMGGNFSAFTDLFIYYIPMYSKFRAPVSILGVAVILVSFLAILTTSKIVASQEILDKKATFYIFKKPKPVYLLVSGMMAFFLLLNIAFPHLFNSYISNVEQNQFNSLRNQPNVANQLDGIINALIDLRIGIFRADLWRAIILLALTTLLLFLYSKKKIKANVFVIAVVTLAIIDFWGISRRYVPIENFSKRSLVKDVYELTNTDKQIYQRQLSSVPGLQTKLDEAINQFKPKNEEEKERLETYVINKYSHYRVFNTTQNPFQENVTTNAHRSVGGYHAIKLHRYQDMIEQYISKMNLSALNMLNTKYIITEQGLQVNSAAMGVAWFVDSIKWANNANEEILALNDINVKTTAVIRSESKEDVPSFSSNSVSGQGSISLDDYEPDQLSYTINSPEEKLVVFSEVFYPDWKVFIDGKESKLFRANYILRAVVVPKGEHKVEFVFHPDHFYTSQRISQIAFIVLIAALAFAVGWSIYSNRKKLKPVSKK
ncbi:YfhO family protein [Maribellus comscasis]|uniref:YfhO family protein n=1 Tax=Maribellus comscasis TaxID=2681766 RepID=A0A6I6JT89_9BACT|nr:YfhO family protein [Maribellus comscasis]QGY44449.1 YfhO family protein [Maribellus comscasis]